MDGIWKKSAFELKRPSVGCYNFKGKNFLFNHAKLPCLISHWRNELQKDNWGKATLSAVITWMSDHCKYAFFYGFKIFKCCFLALKTNTKTKYLQGEDAPLSQISFKVIKSPRKNFAVHNEFTFPIALFIGHPISSGINIHVIRKSF